MREIRTNKTQTQKHKPKMSTSTSVETWGLHAPEKDELLAWRDAWLDGMTPHTKRSYKTVTDGFIRYIFSGVNSKFLGVLDMVGKYVESRLQAGNKISSSRKTRVSLRAFLKYLEDCGKLAGGISKRIVIGKWTPAVVERTISEVNRLKMIEASINPTVKLILKTLYATGLRINECLTLKREKLERSTAQNGRLHVLGKGNIPRTVFTRQSLVDELLDHGDKTSVFIFSTRGGKPLQVPTLYRWLKMTKQAAGLERSGISPHWFRHAHATDAIKGRVPPHVLRRSLGHATLQSTEIYLHAAEEETSSDYVKW